MIWRPPLESDLLRTFLAVARHGNVTRAAEALHRTQSAISVQIGRLEQRLGSKLFLRQARGVSLTESGESLRVAAERIVGELDRTAAAFCASPIGGQVRIGIPDEYGSAVLPDILAAFAARHPAVEVFVQCGFSTAFPQAVARSDLDLAVFAGGCGPGAGPVLFEEETLWVSAKGFRTSADTALPLALFGSGLLVARRGVGRPRPGVAPPSPGLFERERCRGEGGDLRWARRRGPGAQHGRGEHARSRFGRRLAGPAAVKPHAARGRSRRSAGPRRHGRGHPPRFCESGVRLTPPRSSGRPRNHRSGPVPASGSSSHRRTDA